MKTKRRYSLKAALAEQITKSDYPQQTSDFAPVVPKAISLDQLVDKYLVRYERESVPTEGMPAEPVSEPQLTERSASGLRTLVDYLLEQDAAAEEPPPPEEDPMAMDAPADDAPADETAPEETPVMNTPKINLDDFSRSVARLLNNFDALLNPKTIILNRAAEYLRVNYNELTAKQFISAMEQNYGIHATNTDPSKSDSEFPTPYSGGALISASGGGGGA
jgi:hypothetical protein